MIIEIKRGNRTTYKIVSDNYKYDDAEDTVYGDLTTGKAKLVALNITKERHKEIFGERNGRGGKSYTI